MTKNALKTKNDGQTIFSLAPTSLKEAMDYAQLIADSGMVPKQFIGRPADVLVAVQMGAELGLPPTQALQNIAVINGRPSLWGDAVLAVVKASPLCEYVREYWDDATKTATCISKRKGDDLEVIATFSFEDAKLAGLFGKPGTWSQYPKRMAQMRARSWSVRDAFPDVLRGISMAEESLDKEEKDITPVNTQTDPSLSRSDSLLSRLRKEPIIHAQENTIDMDAAAEGVILDRIARAQDEDQLKEAGALAKELPKDGQARIRKEYLARRKELREICDGIPPDSVDVLPVKG